MSFILKGTYQMWFIPRILIPKLSVLTIENYMRLVEQCKHMFEVVTFSHS